MRVTDIAGSNVGLSECVAGGQHGCAILQFAVGRHTLDREDQRRVVRIGIGG